MTHNPECIKEYDYFILDEVHERDVDIDFVFLILKGILKNEKQKKLILMSATIQAEKLAIYFANDNVRSLNLDNYQKNDVQKDRFKRGWNDRRNQKVD